MPLFGRKKEQLEQKSDIIVPQAKTEESSTQFTQLEQEVDEVPEKKVEKEPERPMFAPLFVKLDRYRQILNLVGYLKNSITLMRNSLATLNELEKARNETVRIVYDALEKIEKGIGELDSELVRPAGYSSEDDELEKPEYRDVETVGATIADLREQIEQLKSEVEAIG